MRVFVCLTVVVCALAAGATPASAQGVKFGVKGGAVFATAASDGADAIDFTTGTGAVGGVFVTIDLGSRARLQPELLFGQRRFAASNFPIDVATSGVELPILVQVVLGSSNRVKPVLVFGPQLNLIAKVTQSSALGETDISDDIANVDAALTIGAGVDIAAGGGAVVFDVRVSFGMKDLSTTEGPALKSRGTLVLAGYRF
jgi:hypothetical protein